MENDINRMEGAEEIEDTNIDTVNRILKERAEDLAQIATVSEFSDEASLEIVEFSISHERYGIELQHILDVSPLSEFTSLPSTPAFVVGIVNIRGQVLSIINLMSYLGIEIQGITNLNTVVILQSGQMEFGILVDEIIGVKRVNSFELQSTLPTLSEHQAKYLVGVTPKRCVILDGAKLLASPDIIVEDFVE